VGTPIGNVVYRWPLNDETMERDWSYHLTALRAGLGRIQFAAGVQPFVILFVARTGSNLLAGMLDTHPQILCHHELFPSGPAPHRSLSVREGKLALDLGTAEERDRDPIGFLSRMYKLNAGAKAVGFKMGLSDPNVGVLLALILNRSIRKVVLRRENWLQVYTSALIAEQTHTFIRFEGDAKTPEPASQGVIVDADKFIVYVRKRQLAYRGLRGLAQLTSQQFFEISYEQIKDSAVIGRLLEFLGVEADAQLRERTVKQNPPRLQDRISNYEELSRRLQGTRYEQYLVW
jgi:LPS sulfotransferase NodH